MHRDFVLDSWLALFLNIFCVSSYQVVITVIPVADYGIAVTQLTLFNYAALVSILLLAIWARMVGVIGNLPDRPAPRPIVIGLIASAVGIAMSAVITNSGLGGSYLSQGCFVAAGFVLASEIALLLERIRLYARERALTRVEI